jgi:putative transposase
MDGSIRLRPQERKTLWKIVRSAPTHEQRVRAHLLILLADGHPWALVIAVLGTSSSTINRWRRRYLQRGVAGVLAAPHGRSRSRFSLFWIELVFRWVTTCTPQDFGFYRSRWTCGTIVLLLREDHRLQVGRETVRRWLHQKSLVYRRPRPVLGPQDPERARKVRKIQALLRRLPSSEIAVFQDEVDINTNPKVGSMWMLKGQQATVVTPGTNTKRYLAGSLNVRTGELVLNEGDHRNADLFLSHLDELRSRYRRYRVIHVILDNAIFHRPDRCQKVAEYLKRWGHRIQLHFLPTYAPETNPIERIWWHLHENITRNHRCSDIEDLLAQVFEWLLDTGRFQIETSRYDEAQAA